MSKLVLYDVFAGAGATHRGKEGWMSATTAPPTALTVSLPLPPRLNSGETYYSNHHLTQQARHWRLEAATLVTIARLEQRWTVPAGELQVEIGINRPRADIDAGIKLCLDSIADGLGVNDKLFAVLTLRRVAEGEPGLAVSVRAVEATA